MSISDINFKAAFGAIDKDVLLSYVSGVGHPTYRLSVNRKMVGSVEFIKLTVGGRPEKWICRLNDKYIDIFTSDDCEILIDIASKHFKENETALTNRPWQY